MTRFLRFDFELILEAIFDGHQTRETPTVFNEDHARAHFLEEFHYGFEWEARVDGERRGIDEAAEIDGLLAGARLDGVKGDWWRSGRRCLYGG